jgi:hypothetical protein
MMMQKVNLRIVSLLLILVFLQKLGMELWVHDWLHETHTAHSVIPAEKGKPVVQHHHIICNCLQDAMMPLVETKPIRYEPVSKRLTAIFVTHYSSCLSSDKEFSALRGPPTIS